LPLENGINRTPIGIYKSQGLGDDLFVIGAPFLGEAYNRQAHP